MKITAKDLLQMEVIEEIVPEPRAVHIGIMKRLLLS